MHRRVAFVLVVALAVAWLEVPAFASDSGTLPPPPPPPAPTTHHGGGTFGVGTSWRYGTPGSHGSSGGPVATMCTAKDGTYGKVTARPYTGTDHPPTPPGPGEWYQTFCGGHAGWVWWRGPNGAPAANVQDLVNRLAPVPPDVHLSPTGDQLVNLRTFMWVDPVAVTVPVTAPDGSTITITATPGDVLWDAGDGSPWTWCPSANAAAAYDANKSDDAQSSCSHMYDHSSAGAGADDAFTLTAHVQWFGTWSGTGGAAGGGSLGTIETTSSVPVRVAEVEALNTNH